MTFRKIQRQNYKPAEVAAMLGVSLATIYRRIEEGKITVLPRDEGQGHLIPIEKFHADYPHLRPLFQLSFTFPEAPRPRAAAVNQGVAS